MRKGQLILIMVMALVLVGIISAAPTGPKDLTRVTSSRYNDSGNGGWNVSAQAGNVTELIINATSVTQTWQGYYGNVIGMILLADSSNKTLIDWTLTGVQGQVYASRSNLFDFTTVNCSDAANITAEDSALGSTGKADAVNNTFTLFSHSAFYVGTRPIGVNNCSTVKLRNSTGVSDDWKEVLLSDATGNLVYTALLTSDKNGFNGSNYDFQMIVGENGHAGDTATTPYYFWIELT